jgi:ornithine cyclodeaminase/alanine dehydrogenase
MDITPLQCYNWVEEMLKSKDSVILPPKTSMKLENHSFYNVMPCIIVYANIKVTPLVGKR